MAEEVDVVEQWQSDQNKDPNQMEDENQDQEGQEEQDEEQEKEKKKKRKKKKKDPRKEAEKKRKKLEDAKKRAKKAKKHTKKVAKDVKKSTRKLADTGKKTGKAIHRATAPARAAARRIAMQILQKIIQVIMKIIQQAIKIAMKIAQAAAKILAKLVIFLVSNPIGWIILAILLIIFIVMMFIGDKNEEAGGLGGGSQPIGADYESSEHRDLVNGLLAKTQGDSPGLVIRGSGVNDLDWVEIIVNEETGETITRHPLDLRVLKAIEYLTGLHEYIEIGMLRTDAPDLVRDSVVIDSEAIGGEDKQTTLDTLSAFNTGQAFSIIAVDRTEIPELIPPSGEAPPIAMTWQKTLIERALRPLWEEITFSVGVLDRNIPVYQSVLEDTRESYGGAFSVEKSLSDARSSGDANLYKNSFRTLKRIVTLLDRALGIDDYLGIDLTNAYALDDRTIAHFTSARDQLSPVVSQLENNILHGVDLDELESDPNLGGVVIDSNDMAMAIKYLGQAEVLRRIHQGARFIYKATQVANMVNWDTADNIDLKKAYEARNKIRQVIKELLEMPREVSLFSSTPFDQTMVAKQIITFSPEDDLDNGPERMDIYPYGIKSVDVGGIAVEVLTGDGAADGISDYSDVHFSHAPMSANGVFSKGGANYVNKVSPDISPLAEALDFMDETDIEGQSGVMHDLLVGECVSTIDEDCQKSSYKDYIYVAF